ncbi:hypothetical protein LNP25_27200 [Klebsiella variicola subsp. variicola]|nr:hypothetical protein [Klebsiella variicola subsp. variicola]
MMKVDAVKRGTRDRQIPIAVRSSWRGAMECNGNGLCFSFDVKSPMCPSMKVSNQRIHSPKGRATLVREWLRLLARPRRRSQPAGEGAAGAGRQPAFAGGAHAEQLACA